MAKKIVVPEEILRLAKPLEIQWPIECQLLPAEKIDNTLLVETFSNGNEKKHNIRIEKAMSARLEQSIAPWMYAMGRFALSEKLGFIFGNSTYKGIDRRMAMMLIWISDVWVFDLMKSKTEEITQNILVAMARTLPKKYKKIRNVSLDSFAAFELLRWMATTDRVLGQLDCFTSKGFEAIAHADQSEHPYQSEIILKIAQIAYFCHFIRNLNPLNTMSILASSQFENTVCELFAIMNCPYIPSLNIISGEWKFESI